MATVFAIGGTSESHPGDARTTVTGMLSRITDHLDPRRYTSRWVGYPAEYAAWRSFRDSVAAGVDALDDHIRTTPGDIVLLGYSQGATVVRTYLHNAHADPEPHDRRVKAAGLLADPEAPPTLDPQRYGVLAEQQYPSTIPEWVDVHWASNPADPICSAHRDSLLRTVADFTEWFGFGDPAEWGLRTLNDLRRGHFPYVAPYVVSDTVAEIQRYLPRWQVGPVQVNPGGGQHYSHYIEDERLLPDVVTWLNTRR